MLRELVDLFLEGAPQRIAQLNMVARDPGQLAFHAHALKSMSLNLGAKRIVELARQLEEAGRDASLNNVPVLLKDLEAVFNQTKTHLLALRDS